MYTPRSSKPATTPTTPNTSTSAHPPSLLTRSSTSASTSRRFATASASAPPPTPLTAASTSASTLPPATASTSASTLPPATASTSASTLPPATASTSTSASAPTPPGDQFFLLATGERGERQVRKALQQLEEGRISSFEQLVANIRDQEEEELRNARVQEEEELRNALNEHKIPKLITPIECQKKLKFNRIKLNTTFKVFYKIANELHFYEVGKPKDKTVCCVFPKSIPFPPWGKKFTIRMEAGKRQVIWLERGFSLP